MKLVQHKDLDFIRFFDFLVHNVDKSKNNSGGKEGNPQEWLFTNNKVYEKIQLN